MKNRLTLVKASVALGLGLLVLISGCAVGPDYKRPTPETPAHYKSEELGSWKQGEPLDRVPRGSWWEVFGDEVLNDLERRSTGANQELKAAFARVEQARATARIASSELLPTLDANPSWNRQRYSPNQEPTFGAITATTVSVPLDLSYEVDLWGRVRRGFESARAETQASLASYYSVLLTLHADVARTYLRFVRLMRRSLPSAIRWRFGRNKCNWSRAVLKVGSATNWMSPEPKRSWPRRKPRRPDSPSEGRSWKTAWQSWWGRIQRSSSWLPWRNLKTTRKPRLPEIPAGLPAELLERRPDVSEAERQLASANAQIGIAKAAFFPVVRLTGSGGYVSADVESLFKWDSRVWSIGPSVSLPIFSGGRNQAGYRRSKSVYEEVIANYRQRILVAFQDVENSLSGIQYLAQQAVARDRALASARRAAELAGERYRSGIVSYLEVVDANREALQAERASALLAGERNIAAVQLIKALGGGWDEQALFAKADRQQNNAAKQN